MTVTIRRPKLVVKKSLKPNKPPALSRLYLVGKVSELDETPEWAEYIFRAYFKFKYLFGLSDGDLSRIEKEFKKNGKSFVKAYVHQIAEMKARQANLEILHRLDAKVKIM